MTANLYLHTVNSDLTEGRGWQAPAAFYDNFDTAATNARGAGVMGTDSGSEVHLVPLEQQATAPHGSLHNAGTLVVGYHTTAFGFTTGVVPATQVKPWPADKVARFQALQAQFPDATPSPAPSLASTLPVPTPGAIETVYALVEDSMERIGDYSHFRLNWLSVHATMAAAVAAANAWRQAVSVNDAPAARDLRRHGLLSVVAVTVGTRITPVDPRNGVGAGVVWREDIVAADPAKAAERAELDAMLAELRGDIPA